MGFSKLTTAQGRTRKLPEGVKFGTFRVQPRAEGKSDPDAAAPFIGFEPTGEADTAVIGLTDGRSHWTLRIAPSTGRAELTEGRVEQPIDDRKDLDQ